MKLRRNRTVSSRLTTVLLLVTSQVLLATGLPVAVQPLPGKDRSQPFPCMFKACGCMSAEQCAKSCCCCSKPVAARSRSARPSAILETTTAVASNADRDITPAACCQHAAESTPPETPAAAPAADPTLATTFALAFAVLECRGLGATGRYFSGPAVVATPPLPCLSAPQPVGDRVVPRAAIFEGQAFPPPVPPPRAAR